MNELKGHIGQKIIRTLGELAPTLEKSQFVEKGVLTPQEFVQAGDVLVYKCPTWNWASGEATRVRSHLPRDKQYLVTRNVPCLRRAVGRKEGITEEIVDADEGDDWVCASTTEAEEEAGDIPDIPARSGDDGDDGDARLNDDDDVDDVDDDVPDMADFEEENLQQKDDVTVVDASEENILKTRTYDVSVTYDKYYQTPRVWLFGYDEDGTPLPPKRVFEDISEDHARKTVTIEPHPHSSVAHASIHPCKHAAVMHKVIGQLASQGVDVTVDEYLVLFLKFMNSVIPTITYDYTGDTG